MPTPRRTLVPAVVLALAALAPVAAWAPRPAWAKDKPAPAGPPKTGVFNLDAKPNFPYTSMAVPADYTPTKWYPLLYLMPPISDSAEASKPDQYVKLFADIAMKHGWIVASPAAPVLDNETSISPLMAALKQVTTTYKIDDRRIVVGGYNAGGSMAWRMAVRNPQAFAGVLSIGGEMDSSDRNTLKVLAGKAAYTYWGEKDPSYKADRLKGDEAFLKSAGVRSTVEVRTGWKNEFPVPSLDAMLKWLDDVWPAGTWREKATTLEKAIVEKDVPAGFAALKSLRDDLRKNPYPAYEPRAAALEKSLFDLARAPFEDAKKILDSNPLGALEQTEAAVKAMKGIAAMEKEVAAALAAIKKDSRVIDAIKKRDAEASAKALLAKAEDAEAKGDLAKALELFKKIVALGETSLQKDCIDKVAELEKKVGAAPGK